MLGEYVAIMSMCALGAILFLGGWLSPIPFAPFTWVPGVIWFVLKAVPPVLHDRNGEGFRSALSLRSADAPRLEGLPAIVYRHGGDRGLRPEDHRPRADGRMRSHPDMILLTGERP